MVKYTISPSYRRRSIQLCLAVPLLLLAAIVLISELHDLTGHIPKLFLYPQTRHFNLQSIHPPISPLRPPNAFLRPPDEFAVGEPQPLEVMPEFKFDITPVKRQGMLVPNTVHYISLSPDGHTPPKMTYWQYLAIRSVLQIQRPQVVYLHCDVIPTGVWWDELKDNFTISPVVAPTRIFGNKVWELAHKSDILRILALKYLGGIYLDMDVYLIRPMDDLLYAPTTMGMQGYEYGLCAGVLISAPYSSFLSRFLDSYHHFYGHIWDYNSVQNSIKIAKRYPDEIQILRQQAFFYPNWADASPFLTDQWYSDASGQYAYHAWHQNFKEYLDVITPQMLQETHTSFTKLARRYVGPNDQEIWRADQIA